MIRKEDIPSNFIMSFGKENQSNSLSKSQSPSKSKSKSKGKGKPLPPIDLDRLNPASKLKLTKYIEQQYISNIERAQALMKKLNQEEQHLLRELKSESQQVEIESRIAELMERAQELVGKVERRLGEFEQMMGNTKGNVNLGSSIKLLQQIQEGIQQLDPSHPSDSHKIPLIQHKIQLVDGLIKQISS